MKNISFLPIERSGEVKSAPDLPELAQQVCAVTIAMYERGGFQPPWIAYIAVRDKEYVGTCAFKSPPEDGSVEIAYFTFPDFEGQGVATQMAQELIEIARKENPEISIRAQTLPEKSASTAILGKLGFRFEGAVEHPEDGTVWEWVK